MSLSPSYALSQLEIPYDTLDARGINTRWNDTQTIYTAVKGGTHRTPGFKPVSINPSQINPGDLISLESAQEVYTAAVNAGNVLMAHVDTDTINKFRMLTDGQEFVGQSDLDILGHSQGSVGVLVRLLNNQLASGVTPILYNVAVAEPIFQALNAQAVLPPPPPPPNTPVTMPVPPGVTVPPNVRFQNPNDGSWWIIYTSPFGSVLVRLSSGSGKDE